MAKRVERRIPCILHIPGKYPGPEGREIEPEKLEGFLQMLVPLPADKFRTPQPP